MILAISTADSFGSDIALDADGDLKVTISGSVATVEGLEHVAQSVRINLMTVPYTYLWGTGVGTELAQYVDQPLTEPVKEEVQSIVLDKLKSDPRILQVQDVRIEEIPPNGMEITISALVDAVGAVEIPIRIGGN